MCQHIVAIAQGLGIGLPRDDAAAYMWINLAAANPEADLETRERTAKARDTIESLLSSTQLAEAQRLTREWKPKKFEEPQELPFVFAMRQLRDEMDGKFPAVPNLKPSPAPVPASARFGGGWDVVSEAPAPLSDAEFGKMFDEAAANKAVAPARTPGPAPAPAPAPASHQDTPRSAPIIAAMERVEKKQTPPVTPIDFISQSLCGSLVKDRAALSAQSGGIQGCKKRQLGGRSDIAVDNTANDTAVLVKLYPSGVSQSAAVRVFTIPAYGSWTESGIRAGTYELRYEDLATKAFTKTEPLTLNEVQVEGGVKFSHLKVTLYKVRNGNMKTQPIAKGEFDD